MDSPVLRRCCRACSVVPMADDCGHDHSELDRLLNEHFRRYTDDQKQAYLMLSGMLTLVGVLDRRTDASNTFMTRAEIVEVINESAENYDIQEAIQILARSFDMPL